MVFGRGRKKKVFEPIKVSFEAATNSTIGNNGNSAFVATGTKGVSQMSTVLAQFTTSGTCMGPLVKMSCAYARPTAAVLESNNNTSGIVGSTFSNTNGKDAILTSVGYRLVHLGNRVPVQDASQSVGPVGAQQTDLVGSFGLGSGTGGTGGGTFIEGALTTMNNIYPSNGKTLWSSDQKLLQATLNYAQAIEFADQVRSKRKIEKGDQLVFIIIQKSLNENLAQAIVVYSVQIVTFLQTN